MYYTLMQQFRLICFVIIVTTVAAVIFKLDHRIFGPGPNVNPQLAASGPTPALPAPASGQSLSALPNVTHGAGGTASPDPAAAAAAAAIRADLAEAAKLLTEAAASANEALSQVTAWQQDIEPLRDNADGQAIAANMELARQMRFVLEQQRPSPSDLKQISDRIQSLHDEIARLAASDPPTRLMPDKVTKVRELHRQSNDANTKWTDAVGSARAIAREARRQQTQRTASTATPATPPPQPSVASTNPAPPPPLAATPAAQDASPKTASSTTAPSNTGPDITVPTTADATPPASAPAASASAQPAPPMGSTLQDAVERISDQSKIDANNKQIAEQAERQRREDERHREELKLAEQRAIYKAKLASEARSDEVLRVLQPFLERRNIQPRLAGASLQWRQTVEQQPMSLSALENVGALAETLQGLSMLARVGSHRELSSPRWEFSPSSRTWSADTQDRLKQAQDLLRRLGPTLVDEGLLSR